jgi:hypothetical protein
MGEGPGGRVFMHRVAASYSLLALLTRISKQIFSSKGHTMITKVIFLIKISSRESGLQREVPTLKIRYG